MLAMKRVFFLTGLVLIGSAALIVGQQQNPALQRLGRKKMVVDRLRASLEEPFVGVRTSEGIAEGLFPVRATGVSTAPIREAATAFIESLTPDQARRTLFDVQDPEWRTWVNVDNAIYVRQGTNLKEMTPAQRALARALLRASLSPRGIATSDAIMKTDQSLREINDDPFSYDEGWYFLTMMGVPSATQPWGWQLDGHHLVINYFVLGDQVVMTPTFMGAEPARALTGKYKGNAVLQQEQDLGLALMRSLSPDVRVRALLAAEKPGNTIKAEAFQDNLVLDFAGAEASSFSAEQKARLIELIGLYVGNMREPHAKVRMGEVVAHLDETRFAWVGGTTDDSVFYYRIHSPVILIEFDHQNPVGTRVLHPDNRPTRDHIHTVVRTPNGNDYGKDLLRQHLLAAHGGKY
jgi:hypothetical protein